MDIPIRGQTIDLDQLLKLAGLAASGGQAKELIQGGQVTVNGQVETRRRRTLNVGDIIGIADAELRIIGTTGR
jgi:ribosome-associated protein